MIDLDFLSGRDLKVFTTPTCPDCHRLSALFQARGVAHEKVDILADPAAAERLERETGKLGVPFLLVDDREWVRGYHLDQPGRLKEAVLWDELRAATASSS